VVKQDRWLIIGFLAPAGLVFLGVVLIPALRAIQLSFYKMGSFLAEPEFIGLGNFINLLQNPVFWRDLQNTVVYALVSLVLQLVFGVIVALVLNERFPANNFVRGAAFVPYIIPSIVVSICWLWMLQGATGLIPSLLEKQGLPRVQMLSYDLAMPTVILVSVWCWLPFVALVFLAALQTVPEELFDSAKVDGAGPWGRFVHITVPTLSPVIAMIVLLRGIWMFNKFDVIWLLTGGGPLQVTETLPILSYKKVFQSQAVGEGTAVAVISLIVLLLVVFLYFRGLHLAED
jgi:multiple sugar transport system permease protein